MEHSPPILGFAAWSGTGKTTLLVQLIPLLRERGIRIAVIKHAHHTFDVDQPGKDSHALRKAGAEQMLIASTQRFALMVEQPESREPDLWELIGHLDASRTDLILVEGFKAEPFPKLELFRPSLGKPARYLQDPDIIAVATDEPVSVQTALPVLSLSDVGQIRDFILNWASLS
ncbi:molybdopterin-guanine dinucleotide biosynthesis protein MobB [Ectothiorhodospira lacustris]|uniref:molybdopterin-guanine dinucleotide biosynthesis protein MobB n=1 Tax=Ectothiorhodospira lacustris TaxID=2899127 RepID=UPI001EE835CF|nr:molybdopterin-guanine dinucleotide biosynthesis protein MobB [Ectothiorhodospira lacustris]MCG5500044.1 molybdopterin-guanine dinucleotide biosynthesis protein MobB [Ectothiorhodospira lacustris]MCG5508653.1 molybdopterin-guanine dinucleotide biosynthesis protein MobB [Ectothiorhodospira lacustris]MCG5520444.1 molybdopterin-guanine dinucleotide biosynthesis protein MobB [Ectothiorhodospira lacustris]